MRASRREARNHQVEMPTKRRNTMNRLAMLAMTTVSLLFVGVALLAGDGIGYAHQRSDSDNVNAAVDAFHAALSNLDIGKMQNVWAQEPYVILITRGTKRRQSAGMLSKKTGRTECSASGRVETSAEAGASNPHQSRDGVDDRRCGRRRQKQERSGAQ